MSRYWIISLALGYAVIACGGRSTLHAGDLGGEAGSPMAAGGFPVTAGSGGSPSNAGAAVGGTNMGGASMGRGGGGSPVGGALGVAGTTPMAGSGGADPSCSLEPSMRVRLLSRDEYNRALIMLVGEGEGRSLEPSGLDAHAVFQQLSALARSRAQAADLEQLLPCAAEAVDDECLDAFVSDVAGRAYKRQLRADESKAYHDLYAQTGDVRALLEAVLLSPWFIHEVALGSQDIRTVPVPGGMLQALTSEEFATRLAFLLWGQPPDAALTTRALAVYPLPVGRAALVDEMLADPRLEQGSRTLASRWLELSRLDFGVGDLSQVLAADAQVETRLFFGEAVSSDAGLRLLLQSNTSYLSNALAMHYGVSGGGDDFPVTVLPGAERSGLLTQLSVLALNPSIASRGTWILARLLCQPVPAPPPSAPRTDLTPEAYWATVSNPACMGCHRLIGPIGVAFTSYDPLGKYRTEFADGTPTQTAGELVGSDVDGAFDGVFQLGERLSQSAQVHRCLVSSWLGQATGRAPNTDTCLDPVPEVGLSLKSLLRIAALQESIRLVVRTAVPLAPLSSSFAWEHASREARQLAETLSGQEREALKTYAEWLEMYGSSLGTAE